MNKRELAALTATAFHELGHAVAADELGYPFDSISILADERRGTLGGVGVEGDDGFAVPPGTDAYSPDQERAFREWAFAQAVIDYAGHAAHVALLGEGDMSHRSAQAHGAGEDFSKASLRLAHNRAEIKRAKTRAVEIVSSQEEAIRKLAAALVKYKRLDAQTVEFILTDSPFLDDAMRRLRIESGPRRTASGARGGGRT